MVVVGHTARPARELTTRSVAETHRSGFGQQRAEIRKDKFEERPGTIHCECAGHVAGNQARDGWPDGTYCEELAM